MSSVVDSQASDSSETALRDFLANPSLFFGMSYSEMHSIPQQALRELQRHGLSFRFQQQRTRIEMLTKLADRQGIDSVDEFEDVVPLLFEHTMYKSYPVVLLEQQQFDKLTRWLGKLTSVDLSHIDASSIDSIDAWRDQLYEEAGLAPSISGGTSGTMSFFPWHSSEHEIRALSRRVSELQTFGSEPTQVALHEPFHYVCPASRNGSEFITRVITNGEPGHTHLLDPGGESADLLWLAARIRLAAARGDVSRVHVPENLLRRRDELRQKEAQAEQLERAFADEIAGLQGELVFWMDYPFRLYDLAVKRLEQGEHWSFGPDSSLVIVGGAKGHALPEDWFETVKRFVDIPVRFAYGMTEICMNIQCSAGRYHLQPWVIPYILDPETSKLLPREGTQTGRAAFFDLLADSHWGGLITGDEIEVDFDGRCACGATTQHVGPNIQRLSEKRGGDDKIVCAAAPEAHAEAMKYLITY